MLVVSALTARQLLGAAHMGEPNRIESTLVIPFSDVCLLQADDEENKRQDDTEATVLRPRNNGNSGSACISSSTLDVEELNCGSALPLLPLFDNGETCSSDLPPKTVATPHAHSVDKDSNDSVASEVAVREDAEANQKEKDGQGRCDERQSPSPSPSFIYGSAPMRTQRLSSALKTASSKSTSTRKRRSHRTKRRIRGIWGDDTTSQLSQLHDETILLIFSNLSMKDLCVASMVCERWKHLALHQDSWKRIDATDFVETTCNYFVRSGSGSNDETASSRAAAAPKFTSLALASRVEKYTPIGLSIHSIHQRLSPDDFLSSLPILQELTLTSFDELTDTHLHVLLLSSSCKNAQARSKRYCVMKKLVLEDCPRLTDATVRSIGKLCTELEELSLKGSSKITDLTPLRDLWTLTAKQGKPASAIKNAATAPMSASSMFSLFSPPPAAPVATVADLFQPTPRPSTPTTTNSLQSLFAPPGLSPPRSADVMTILPRPLSKKNSKAQHAAKLASVNVSYTGVTAKNLLAAWKAAVPPGKIIRLSHLSMHGNGESWNDALLGETADLLDLVKLESLEIGCKAPSRTVTDKGLQRLIEAPTGANGKKALSLLKRLNLAGHQALTGTCIAQIMMLANETLEELTLDGCKGLSAQSNNAAHDFSHMDAFAQAVLKCTTRERKPGIPNCGRGLRRLSLSRCFANQSLLQKNESKKIHEETLGSFLLESLGPKPKKLKGCQTLPQRDNQHSCTTTTNTGFTLLELDLTDCWFVTSSDIASLRKRCPILNVIHLEGTRAML
jgi:F-box-like